MNSLGVNVAVNILSGGVDSPASGKCGSVPNLDGLHSAGALLLAGELPFCALPTRALSVNCGDVPESFFFSTMG